MTSFAPVVICAGLAGLAYISMRLKIGVQPQRLELADRGKDLLADASLPQDMRALVEQGLGDAFGARAGLLMSMAFLPLLLVKAVFKPEDAVKTIDPTLADKFQKFMATLALVTAGNNPILSFLFALELLCALALVLILRAISGKRLEIKPSAALKVYAWAARKTA